MVDHPNNSWLLVISVFSVGLIACSARLCGLLLQMLHFCLCVGHGREPCKNGWTDQDVVCEMDLCVPKEPCVITETERDVALLRCAGREFACLHCACVLHISWYLTGCRFTGDKSHILYGWPRQGSDMQRVNYRSCLLSRSCCRTKNQMYDDAFLSSIGRLNLDCEFWFWKNRVLSTVQAAGCNRHAHTSILRSSWILFQTTRVSQHQKGKTNLDLLEQEIVSGSAAQNIHQ